MVWHQSWTAMKRPAITLTVIAERCGRTITSSAMATARRRTGVKGVMHYNRHEYTEEEAALLIEYFNSQPKPEPKPEQKQEQTMENDGDLHIGGLRLVCTCGACPEQYDVFSKTGDKVGYLRLRHGHFRADVPDAGDETVYEAHPKGDGVFEPEERMQYLTEAVEAIKKTLVEGFDY